MAYNSEWNQSDANTGRGPPQHKKRGPKRGAYDPLAPSDAHSTVQAESEATTSKVTTKCCAFWCVLVTAVLLLTFFLLLFFVIVPALAQAATDDSTMTVLRMRLSNATNDSILMNVTLQVSNAGAFDATIKAALAEGYDADTGAFIGTLQLPDIAVKANTGAVFDVVAPLTIANATGFRAFTQTLLSGRDASMLFKAKPRLDVKLAGITIATKVDMKHAVVLGGSRMENPVASNFTVVKALESGDTLQVSSQISFSTTLAMSMAFSDVQIDMYDEDGVKVGYTLIPELTIEGGYNCLENLPTYLVKNEGNLASVERFFSTFLMGRKQKVNIIGPVPTDAFDGGKKIGPRKLATSVIDYVLNQTVMAEGSTAGDTILSGIETSSSQAGWKVAGPDNTTVDVRGAYATIRNPLAVDIRITHSSVDAFLEEPIAFIFDNKVRGYFPVLKGNCNVTDAFARISTGYGMYEEQPNKTWVDIEKNGVTNFFAIAEPQPGQFGYETAHEEDCVVLDVLDEPYPCCFLMETLATICRENPGLKNGTIGENVELKEDFIRMNLVSNMTLLIDSYFHINLTYNQSFFPLYYGKQVYSGYLLDLWTDCPDIEITNNKDEDEEDDE